jgi:phosphatidylglycerophosphate synthase
MTAIVITTGRLARGPVLERLLAQLYSLGVTSVHLASPDEVAAIAHEADGGLLVLHGDIVTNTEALAGLIADPRIANGTLAGGALKVASPDLVTAPDGEDAVASLTEQLERAGVALREAPLRGMAWARPATPEEAEVAIAAADAVDEEQIRLDSAVKPVDGFFTTFFVSPYSRYIARWAARRGITPNQVTVASFAVGLLAAAGFATGERWGLVAGAILLQVAFTLDCVDGQLARYSRQFSDFGGWLDATFDRSKEWVVFAGLAIGADTWVLAAAALTLQVLRHFMDFGWQEVRGEADAELAGWDRPGGTDWVKRIIAFPIGERFAAISITAALWSAHTTFVVLLVWGGFAGIYGLAGRVLRSFKLPEGGGSVAWLRDDGPLARRLPGMMGRLGWLVPVLVRLVEYGAVVWIGALGDAEPAAFALVAALALRQYDIVYGLRYRGASPRGSMGGWDGRIVLAVVLLVVGALPAGFYAMAAVIAVGSVATAIRDWTMTRRHA